MADHRASSYGRNPNADRRSIDRLRSAGAFAYFRWLPLLIVVLGLALGYAFDLHHYLSLEALRHYQARLSAFVEANVVLAAVAYVGVYIVAVALSFPGASVLTAAGGLMFGCVAGTILAVFAATVGGTAIFLIARTTLGGLLAERAGPRLQRLRQGLQEDGFRYLLFLRLVPLFPFWIVNIAAGIFAMRLAPYVAATAIGIVPATFAFSYFGEGLGTALERDGSPFSAKLFIGLALLGALVLMPALVRTWRSRQKERGAPS